VHRSEASAYDLSSKVPGDVRLGCTIYALPGEFDQSISGPISSTSSEAHALFHLPWLTSAGVDVKGRQFT